MNGLGSKICYGSEMDKISFSVDFGREKENNS